MNKKAIAILGAIFLLIVGTLGFLIYAKYGSSKSNNNIPVTPVSDTATTPVASTTPVTPPASAGQKFVKLMDDQVISPTLFYNGQGITYFDPSGQLYQVTLKDTGGQLQAGSPQSLSIESRSGIDKVFWPTTGDDFIVQSTPRAGTKMWSYYNSKTRSYTDLPANIESFDWLSLGTQIYYIWLDKNKATLNIGNPDATSWKYIADMWEPDDALSVSPDGKNILYYEQTASSSTNPIYLTTPDGKVWKTPVPTGFNMGVLWSPDSQKFLFAKKDSSGTQYELWYYDLLSGEVRNLGLMTTTDKTVWGNDSQTIYAAVPSSGIAGGDSFTVDTFYKLDTQTGNKQQYSPGAQVLDGRDLFLNNDQTKLFFKNAQDGALYYLDLTSGQ